MEQSFLDRKQTSAAVAHQATYEAAVKLMHSEKAKSVRSLEESESAAKLYGTSSSAAVACSRAGFVEFGVPFVEVDMGGWEHSQGQLRPSEKPQLSAG